MNSAVTLSFDQWFDRYMPIINPNNHSSGLSIDGDFYMFETYGNDYQTIRNMLDVSETSHVWTVNEIDSELIIFNGFHESYSTFGYFITYEPALNDVRAIYLD